MRSFLLLTSLAALAACTPQLPEGVFVCATNADCPPSWSCDATRARCVSGDSDASVCPAEQMPSATGCVDRDECAGATPCGAGQASCTNLDPGYACTCASGYVVSTDARACNDVDECDRGSDDCLWNATCANTSGGFDCTCGLGFAPNANGACLSTCVPGADSDPGNVTFTIGHASLLDVSNLTAGFDIDGLNNAARGIAGGGVGKSIEGCDTLDEPLGVDNSVSRLAQSLSSTLDLISAFDNSVSSGATTISFQLTKLVTGGASDDPCVAITATVNGQQYNGVGALDDHVLTVTFGSTIVLPMQFNFPAGSCNTACSPQFLPFHIRGARARLTLDATNTVLLEATLGGYDFFDDDTGDSAYDGVEANGLKARLTTFATDSDLMGTLVAVFTQAFQTATDLHMEPGGLLSACSAPVDMPANPNENTVSFALRLTP